MKLQVIGDPVLHSKSPVIHGAMLEALGLDVPYAARVVRSGELPQYLAWSRENGVTGFNATMPHKEELVPLMDWLDPVAEKCGAVNTICIKDGKYYGYNTDGGGFLRALGDMGVSPAGKRVLLLGAGGAAKAVAAALSEAGAMVTVANRTVEKAAAICQMDPEHLTPAGFEIDTLCKLSENAHILINCTSLGMAGTESRFADLSFVDALSPTAVVCDAIYAPPETALLRGARETGRPAMNGMGMLLHQAILALEHFTGEPLDAEKAKAAALAALKAEGAV